MRGWRWRGWRSWCDGHGISLAFLSKRNLGVAIGAGCSPQLIRAFAHNYIVSKCSHCQGIRSSPGSARGVRRLMGIPARCVIQCVRVIMDEAMMLYRNGVRPLAWLSRLPGCKERPIWRAVPRSITGQCHGKVSRYEADARQRRRGYLRFRSSHTAPGNQVRDDAGDEAGARPVG